MSKFNSFSELRHWFFATFAEHPQNQTSMELEEMQRIVDETIRIQRETAQQMAEMQRKNDREFSRVSKQIGEIGNKFGSFTEGMAFPSMEKLLRRKFKMTFIAANVEVIKDGDEMELDVFAYANEEVNAAIVVEVKSHLRERDVEQVLKMMEKFPRFFPEHRGKKLYGILAGGQVPTDVQRYALKQGLMVARIADELFDLKVPEGFQPKDFQAGQ